MRKHFILSTRTVVSKRNVTQSFGSDNTVIIPMAVLDDVQNKYATQHTERGKIAEGFLKYLSDNYGIKKLKEGVVQPNGSILKVTTNFSDEDLTKTLNETDLTKIERRILQTCVGIKKSVPANEPVVLVSKSPLLRMKAEMLGVKAQTFRDELLPEIHEQYTGRKELFVSDDKIKEFYKNRKIRIDDVVNQEERREIYPNMFIQMKGVNDRAIGRVYGDYIVELVYSDYHPYGVIPKNVAQKFMIEALMMDEEIAPLVIFKGPAGTAKTFMSLAVGLDLVSEHQKFDNKILISRSPTETGEKIGYLPGGELEKISPYLRGVMDNLKNLHERSNDETEIVMKKNAKSQVNKKSKDYSEKPQCEDGSSIFAMGMIKAEAVGYIRGRSICDTYIIIDEAQNLSPVEVKTIITRVGTGTKLILIGDPEQIDRPELDERNNGLSYASERLKGEETCWQITLTDDESVRSELAKRASMLL